MDSPGRLTVRDLTRATLDRQLLLRRHPMPALSAIEHLVGLQAQAPLAPYVGLWTRLAGFGQQELKDLLTERAVVRAHLMRNTVHLVTAADYISFRPLFQPLMNRALAANFGSDLTGVDLAELRDVASALLAETPLTRAQLAGRLAPRWPGHAPGSLAYAVTHLVPVVQVPPRGLWGQTGQATWFLAAAWLEGAGPQAAPPLTEREAAERLVLRYLAAYGPASVNDIQAWSGLSRLREVTDRLAARLGAYPGPDGGELLDLPDAPGPRAPRGSMPPRFLPEYDNLLLSFAERSRVIPHDRPVPLPPGNGATSGTLLIGGQWLGGWTITRGRDRAVLEVRPFRAIPGAVRDAVADEASRLLEFAAAGVTHDVRFAPVG
jgi:Winged helix DNA-binding domain